MFSNSILKRFFCTAEKPLLSKAKVARGKPLAKLLESGMKRYLDRITVGKRNIYIHIKKFIFILICYNTPEKNIKSPKISVVTVGNNPNSLLYVSLKIEQFKRVGIENELIHLEENIERNKLIEVIQSLNAKDAIDGILLQVFF